MIEATAIVPFRADRSGVRLRNAHIVLQWLASTGMQVVLSEHSAAPDERLQIPRGVRRLHVRSGEAFSKAVAINIAAAQSKTAVIALVDADTLVRPGVLEATVNRVLKPAASHSEHLDGIRPFGFLVELSEQQSLDVAASAQLPTAPADSGRDDTRGLEHIPACGGMVVLRKESFINAGGMDETFTGWGGEDDALSCALERSGAALRILGTEPGFHLWHPREERDRYGHASYVSNLEKAQWWRTAPLEDVQLAMKSGRDRVLKLRTDKPATTRDSVN